MDVLVVRVVDGPGTGRYAALTSDVIVGRDQPAGLVLGDPTVSARHLLMSPAGPSVTVTDLGSSNGTRIGTDRAAGPTTVGPGTHLRLGASELVVLEAVTGTEQGSGSGPVLLLSDAGHTLRRVAVQESLVIGRDKACDVVIDQTRASRQHLAVEPAGPASIVVTDLQSRNGTEVNGRRISRPSTVGPGDVVRVGGTSLLLTVEPARRSDIHTTQIRVRLEGSHNERSVTVDASPATTVAEVTAALGAALDTTGELCLYDADRGVGFAPGASWYQVGVRRGDLLTLASGTFDGNGARPAAPRPYQSAVTRQPRTLTVPAPTELDAPRAPEGTSLRGRGVQWQLAAGVTGLAVAATLALVSPSYRIIAIVGGVAAAAGIVAGVAGEQSRRRYEARTFRDRLRDLDTTLARLRVTQADTLRALWPDAAALAQWARERGPQLWSRRPGDADFLELRVGVGVRPSTVTLNRSSSDARLEPEIDAVWAKNTTLSDVPVTVRAGTVVGVVGPRGQVLDLATRAVTEAAVGHAPGDLQIVIAGSDADWAWARWLPHANLGSCTVATDTRAAGDLLEQLGTAGEGRPCLTVIGHANLTGPHVAAALARTVAVGGLAVVLADSAGQLPPDTNVVLDLTGHHASFRGPAAPVTGPFHADGVEEQSAAIVALSLAGYLDPRATGASASMSQGVLDLLGITDPEHLPPELWSGAPERLTVAVGSTDNGDPVELSFRRHGPHGVIAGTTGSGKSELLLTLIAGLATRYPPDQLNLFLIDFKGGSAFRQVAALPHVAGVVTDLEGEDDLVDRAFTALEAELSRRKKILADAHVSDVIAYEQAGLEPLPDLLVIIDEFASLILADDEVKTRLDTTAMQGRSLGVHFLLATQDPSRVISPALRANTNMWLCLRVVDAGQSKEILGVEDAARIDPALPGRAFWRVGAGEAITGFQVARITRPLGSSGGSAVTVAGFLDPTVLATRPAPVTGGRSELAVLVASLVELAESTGAVAARPLWVDPLPEHLDAARLDAAASSTGPEAGLWVRVGLADLPDEQRQEVAAFQLAGGAAPCGNVVVIGTLGTGKTTALVQVAADLAGRYAPADLHLYGFDAGGGSLAALTRLPHAAGVVGAGDPERLVRAFGRLSATIARRRDEIAAAGGMPFGRWREQSGEPWVVALIDDFPALKEAAESLGQVYLLDQFLALIQHGPTVGVHAFLTTQQAYDVRSTWLNLFGGKLLLRQGDTSDYGLVGRRYRTGDAPKLPPGRAFRHDGVAVQVAVPSPEWPEDVMTGPGGPTPVRALPTRVTLDAVLDHCTERAPTTTVVGVGGLDVVPVVVDFAGGEPVVLVLGDAGSGRTTTLLTVARSASGPVLGIAPKGGPLTALTDLVPGADVVVGPAASADKLAELADSEGALPLILVDDADAIGDDAAVPLEHLLRELRSRGGRCVLAARAADLSGLYQGWSRYLLALEAHTLLLQPSQDAASVAGVRLPPQVAPMVVGRGYLSRGGPPELVQVAIP